MDFLLSMVVLTGPTTAQILADSAGIGQHLGCGWRVLVLTNTQKLLHNKEGAVMWLTVSESITASDCWGGMSVALNSLSNISWCLLFLFSFFFSFFSLSRSSLSNLSWERECIFFGKRGSSTKLQTECWKESIRCGFSLHVRRILGRVNLDGVMFALEMVSCALSFHTFMWLHTPSEYTYVCTLILTITIGKAIGGSTASVLA